MLVHKTWDKVVRRKTKLRTIDPGSYVLRREGWFLFGFLPLFIRDVTVRQHANY